MNNSDSMRLLFQHARDHRFKEFDLLFSKMEAVLPPNELREAYLLRAQIKLYVTDLTILDDLKKAEMTGGTLRFPPLCIFWKSDGVNRFIVFPTADSALKDFLTALPVIQGKLYRWYDGQSDIMVRQVQCEIYYFMGEVEKALALSKGQYKAGDKSSTETMYALTLQYRCFLGMAEPEKAQQCMFEIIRMSKTYPECVDIYAQFRSWANMTTGWSGDSPRFYEDEDGETQPFLSDRVDGIKSGLSNDTILEMPFIKYGGFYAYNGAYSLRQYYMDLFHAIYWLSVHDYKQAQSYFQKIYEVMMTSGVLMPIIECGGQVMPLLKYIQKNNTTLCLDRLMARAAQYEKGLWRYRLMDK